MKSVPSKNGRKRDNNKKAELPEYKIDVAPSVMQIMSEKCFRDFFFFRFSFFLHCFPTSTVYACLPAAVVGINKNMRAFSTLIHSVIAFTLSHVRLPLSSLSRTHHLFVPIYSVLEFYCMAFYSVSLASLFKDECKVCCWCCGGSGDHYSSVMPGKKKNVKRNIFVFFFFGLSSILPINFIQETKSCDANRA